MKEVQYKVENISCAGCGAAITNVLRKNAAVDKVDVDIAEKSVHVVFDENITNEETLKASLDRIGYHPVLENH